METAPVKSQPLHNFSLPFLKWGQKNQMNTNHRCRKPSDLTRDSPPMATDHHRSSPSEHDSDGGSKNESESENLKLPVGSRTVPNRFSFSSCSTLKHQAAVLEKESNDVCVERQRVCDDVEVEESAAKPWNLRPRKAVSEVAIEIGVVSRKAEFQETCRAVAAIAAVQRTENLPKSLRLRGFAEGQCSEKKEKRKFWISLSREEIEEDVYAMSGVKPARRPKRRPKNVQKQLDVFLYIRLCFDPFDCLFTVRLMLDVSL
ncbi:hypothetical protein F0562_012099 [Nyssa sinensis]|uniref:Uncharacterized protein n=1 Tax=Nyssa sinensis TaxID=561372 RepID=A0A5J4ZTK0_9ASTE|nr:hypothetical protein F0562_012099 [Nyssa sinensis]